jgi:hypothetical protein
VEAFGMFEFNIFCTLVTMAMAAILNFCNPKKSKNLLNPPFLNGYRCHGNGQNAKKFKNTKMIISGYSPIRN